MCSLLSYCHYMALVFAMYNSIKVFLYAHVEQLGDDGRWYINAACRYTRPSIR